MAGRNERPLTGLTGPGTSRSSLMPPQRGLGIGTTWGPTRSDPDVACRRP